MSFNPNIHHRRSIRLKGYDYTRAGAYFITICCDDRICRFGKVVQNEMILNEFGWIAFNEWINLKDRFINFELDVFQVMPNHFHGIIVLNDVVASVEASVADAQMDIHLDDPNDLGAFARDAPTNRSSISDIIGAYKSLVANRCLDIYKSKNESMGKFWQRNYYENIIRDEQSYQRISNYIMNNPVKWNEDKFYRIK